MSQLLRAVSPLLTLALALGAAPARAAQVRGSVEPPAQPPPSSTVGLGYTVTRVAAPAKRISEAKQDVALFLRSKESLPIPAPTEHLRIVIEGMQLTPNVATCAVDAHVEFENRESEPVTVKVGDTNVGPIPPGETAAYTCVVGEPEDPRQIRIPRWRHVSGLVYVAQSGVAGRLTERGTFALNAPQGTYELQFVTASGVVERQSVEIQRSDVDVGRVDLAGSDEDAAGGGAGERAPDEEP